MAEVRRSFLRSSVVVAVVVLGILDVEGMIGTIREGTLLRERVLKAARDAAMGAQFHYARILTAGTPAAFTAAAREAVASGAASEFQVFDGDGKLLFAQPSEAPVRHWPPSSERKALEGGQVLAFGPVAGDAARLLTYMPIRTMSGLVIARFATPVGDLVQDLSGRRHMLVGHGLSLLLLLAAAGLALFPVPEKDPSPQTALYAYEEAMRRLAQHGLDLSREHEEERQRLSRDLEEKEALARAGELTTGIAHEVRNGLGTIVGYARLIERNPSDKSVQESAVRIREECETLEGVIRRFIDFVRRESMNPVSFDFERMLRRVVARESRGCPECKVTIDGVFGELRADEELLESAVSNLVRNALEAAGPEGCVSVRGSREGEQLFVRIVDDGPGMRADLRANPRPFFTTKPGGLGLGLAMVFKIAGLHQGDVRLEEASPHGLAVLLRLPVEPDVTISSEPAGP